MKFGRRGLKTDYRTLKYMDYVTREFPLAPDICDQFTKALETTGAASIEELFPIDYNDELGDCTIAGLAHAATLYEAMIGQGLIPGADDVRVLYGKLSGGADQGLYCLDVLRYAKSNAFLGTRPLLAFVKLDPKNHSHVKQAIANLGCVYLGFQCQEGCIEDFEAGRPWTPGQLTQDGHCVTAGAYDEGGLTLATWGSEQQGTWEWWDKCVDEAYALLPSEAEDGRFAPGFSIEALKADLENL